MRNFIKNRIWQKWLWQKWPQNKIRLTIISTHTWTLKEIWRLLSWALCTIIFWFFLHYWCLCSCEMCRNDDCTELWKMTIRLILGFRLKSVGCLLCSPIWTNKTFYQSYNSVFRKTLSNSFLMALYANFWSWDIVRPIPLDFTTAILWFVS